MSTSNPDGVNERSPWHAGEIALQARIGVAERMREVGSRVIRDHMPEQHRAFFTQLPFVVLGALAADGAPWASLLEGAPGFVHSPDDRRLRIDAQPSAEDPLGKQLHDGAALGVLGIELHTRRRNRMNGVVTLREGGMDVTVRESFGNCPQYIQRRVPHAGADNVGAAAVPVTASLQLNEQDRALIATADTFFVASGVKAGQGVHADSEDADSVDVSHRGGRPGFVKVEGNRLTVPDFAGNRHFNTLGNFLLNPRAGLLFIDFERGDLLHVLGDVTLVFDGPELAGFAGAERLWQVDVRAVLRRPAASSLRLSLVEPSPRNALTGAWVDSQAVVLPGL